MTTTVIKHPSDCEKCAICRCRCCIKKRTTCSRVKKTLMQADVQVNNHERRCLLILVRHGMSEDEIEKRYSSWNDSDLSDIGKQQMHRTGQALHQANFSIDICFTSVLKRAIKSLFIIQEEIDHLWVSTCNTWRLNDRMLGNLTGFHHDRAQALFGQNQIKEWLTQPHLAPPPLEQSNILHPRLNYKYRHIYSIVPSTETLFDVRKRLLPFFYDQLFNNLYLAQNILLVTHQDIIKAIIRLLNNYTVDAFDHQQIPIGVPIVFEFSLNTKEFFNGYYLSSSLFPNNTHDQHQLFPTGFDKESKSFQQKTNLHIEQNFTDISRELFQI